MKKKSEHFFSAGERERIQEAIHKAEKDTSGEIVMMVVDESDPYREAVTMGALLFSALASLFIVMISSIVIDLATGWSDGSSGLVSFRFVHAIFNLNPWLFIALAVLLHTPARHLLAVFPKLKFFFVPKHRKSEAVRDHAIRIFYEKGLHRTKHETGVLILISILERRVWILGDRGINEKISKHFWYDQSRALSRGIAESRSGEAAREVIERCGRELARHFPAGKRNDNELSDNIISD
jgi:putative membrane protein